MNHDDGYWKVESAKKKKREEKNNRHYYKKIDLLCVCV